MGSLYLQWDLEMYDEETDTAAKANTSDLNEELGQVGLLNSFEMRSKEGVQTKSFLEHILYFA